MRELALWDADEGVSATFEDVEALESACRFSDCKHTSEPGCAVRAAIGWLREHDPEFEAAGRDAATVRRYMNGLKQSGAFTIEATEMARIRAEREGVVEALGWRWARRRNC